MKILLLICVLLCAACSALPSTSVLADAPPRANVVAVAVADSARAAYARLGQVVVAAGYDLEKASYDAEKAFYLRQANYNLAGTSSQVAYLTTIYRNLPERPELRTALRAVVLLQPSGSTVELRGTYTLDGLKLHPIANEGKPGSPSAQAWAELQRVVTAYAGNSAPSYRREAAAAAGRP